MAPHLLSGSLRFPVRSGYELIHELPVVLEVDGHSLVQEGQLAEPVGQGIILIDSSYRKHLGIRMEGDDSTGVIACTCLDDRGDGLSFAVLLGEDLPLTVDFRRKAVRKGIDTGDTHTVETSGNLIILLAELAAGMKHGHDNLEGVTMLLGVHSDRDSTSVVPHLDGVVMKDRNIYAVAEACHGFIDGVVNHFVNQMMESPLTYVSDVHRRPFAHGLKSFQHLDATCGILLFRGFHFICLWHLSIKLTILQRY